MVKIIIDEERNLVFEALSIGADNNNNV
jgi:hypothetical protein